MSEAHSSGYELASALTACTDRIYAVPGYPVTDLVSMTRAMLVINEKVALEFALGDSLAGRRACVIVKHVGMNALLDPLVHATFQGIRAGVVILCGDDPTAKKTMTVQDSRCFGPVAQIPVLNNPSPSDISKAFDISEKYSRATLIRLTPDHLNFQKDEVGVSAGACRCKTSVSPGSLADPDLTMYGRAALAGAGSDRLAAEGLSPVPYPSIPVTDSPLRRSDRGYALSLCHACPFRALYEKMQIRGICAICDTGCSLIAMNPPFSFGIASFGMGSAIGVAAQSGNVALIGDYALLHTGLQSLIEVYRQQIPLLTIVMVNRCMGMTGGQPTGDPLPYLGFANPDVCDMQDLERLDQLLAQPNLPRTILVYGRCPEVITHETVAC